MITKQAQSLIDSIRSKQAKVGIIGLGYVGLPLAIEFASKGFAVLGFDLDDTKVVSLNGKRSYIKHISSERIAAVVSSAKFAATNDFSRLSEVDAVIICVPTPLDHHRQPDMTYIVSSADTVSKYLRKGQLVSLESSTYPGTTNEILLPRCEKAPIIQSGDAAKTPFKVGEDFFLAFSPEREDPANPQFSTSTIPKVVGGTTPSCVAVADVLYSQVIVKTVPVSSTQVAEATKLLENIYRSVNIAMVNELKMVFDKMGIDVWEVIDAASTKPFGFQPFYPGPGLGGHCIPIDPFYLTWKAHEFETPTKFIELAGEINTSMPYYVLQRSWETLNAHKKALNGSAVLILGAAYKKDVDDMRESPSLKLFEIFRDAGAKVDYNDPHIPELPKTRKYDYKMKSVELTPENLKRYDLVILSTDHSAYDYAFITKHASLIIDTRNAFRRRGVTASHIYRA